MGTKKRLELKVKEHKSFILAIGVKVRASSLLGLDYLLRSVYKAW